MSYLREVDLGPSFTPFVAFQEQFGFVPNLFRAQTLLPRVIEAEAGIAASVLLKEQALSRIQKEYILLTVAAAQGSSYCAAAHHHILHSLGVPGPKLDQIISDYSQADLSSADTALLNFSLKLGKQATSISREDVRRSFAQGVTDESLLEAVLVTSLANFLCTLAAGLGPSPDFEPRHIPPATNSAAPSVRRVHIAEESFGPYLRAVERSHDDFLPFAFFREEFGFIPNIFRAQTLRPDVLEAEAGAIRAVLLTRDVLTRVQKECILLVISAANLNTYCVAVHCELLRGLGVSLDDSDQIAVDHHQAHLSAADQALLDFALKLTVRPTEMCREDVELLRRHGFAEEQILEAIVMTSLTSFLNTLQMGLGTTPDFPPRRVFRPGPKAADHLAATKRPPDSALADPDAELVTRVQSGDVTAFEELITRHSQLVYRTLVGILGDREEARDAMQDTFLKAFQHVGDFGRRSKFSTWLVSIASNTGIQRLRERKPIESLDENTEGKDFRPRQVRAWADDPEQLYSQAEIQDLVESSVMKLPASYRIVLVLRDLQQLSTEEAATALGLGIPALKARLFRGRLLLREILSPHFVEGAKEVAL